MIDLYTFGTGNGRRASIALEECGLPYTVYKVNIAKGEQKMPAFRKINPLGRIPAIVDSDGPGGSPITVIQSGAILVYCAEKSGKFLPNDPGKRVAAMQWMLHAVSDGSDAIGGVLRMSRLPEKSEAAVALYKSRLASLLQDVNEYLGDHEYLVDDISIADLAFYTVAAQGAELIGGTDALPNLKRWLDTMSVRPGVIKGMAVPE